ncbi:MAG: hypothetical protein K2H49_03535 [Muribaculaceae bacterium]|nr:hypothetical protein [Muribaculaceae bacterium]
MNKEDVRLMTKSDEQTFASSLQGTPLSSWEIGKQFLAMSDRTQFIFEPLGINDMSEDPITGVTLTYKGTESRINPNLEEDCIILFTDGNRTLRYPTGKPTERAMKEIDSARLPLLADLELIEKWNEKLHGKTPWTNTDLWYDRHGERCQGQKYAKVKVMDVVPATGDFPMKVRVSRTPGEESYIQMNYTSDMFDSRNFASVFFLTDPKSRYPQISEDNWGLIKDGKVGPGMTKDECKLALGNPDEVNSGHNHSQTMDIWQYANGTYLVFTDGLLTRFRQ